MFKFILVLLSVHTMLSAPIEPDYIVKNGDIVNMEILEKSSDTYRSSTGRYSDEAYIIDENDYAGYYGVDILSCAIPKDLIKVENVGHYKSHRIFKYTGLVGRVIPDGSSVGDVYYDTNAVSFESVLGRVLYITFSKFDTLNYRNVENNSVVNGVNMALAEMNGDRSFYAYFTYKGVNFQIVATVSRKEFVDILYSVTSL